MSGPRRHYSEKWANKPVIGDQVRNTAVPLGRHCGTILPDRPLTPEKQEVSDKIRSYVRPAKNINTFTEPTRKKSKPEDRPCQESFSRREQILERQQSVNVRQPLYKTLAGKIGQTRHSVPPANNGVAIDQKRKSNSGTKPLLEGRGEISTAKGAERPNPLSANALKRTEKNGVGTSKGTPCQRLQDSITKDIRRNLNMEASTSAKSKNKIPASVPSQVDSTSKISFVSKNASSIDLKINTPGESATNSLQPFESEQFWFLKNEEVFSKAIELFTTAINQKQMEAGERWLPSIKLKSPKMRSLISEHRKTQSNKRLTDLF